MVSKTKRQTSGGIYAPRSKMTSKERLEYLDTKPTLFDSVCSVKYQLQMLLDASNESLDADKRALCKGLQAITSADPADPEVKADAKEALLDINTIHRIVAIDVEHLKLPIHTLHSVIEASIRLGRNLERLQVRPFERLVRGKQSSEASLTETNKKKGKSDALRHQALHAIERAKQEHPHRKNDTDFIKQCAAQRLGIKKRSLNKRLTK